MLAGVLARIVAVFVFVVFPVGTPNWLKSIVRMFELLIKESFVQL